LSRRQDVVSGPSGRPGADRLRLERVYGRTRALPVRHCRPGTLLRVLGSAARERLRNALG